MERYCCWRRGQNGNDLREEIETHHLFVDEQRLLMVEDVIATDNNHLKTGMLYRYQYSNHLGSVGLEMDEQAKIISYEEYHPYGTSAYQLKNRTVKASYKRYRYTGMERDEETGLNYHAARYYAPWLGRWVSCDPIGIEDLNNLYVYSKNNSLVNLDTDGEKSNEPRLDNTSIKYLVPTVKQKGLLMCLYAATKMLVQHKLEQLEHNIDLRFGGSGLGMHVKQTQTIYAKKRWLNNFSSTAYEKSYKKIVARYMGYPKNLHKYLRENDLYTMHIGQSPRSFLNALLRLGPFIYLEKHHALVVTGVFKKEKKVFLSYNDPVDGKRNTMGFWEFLIKYPTSKQMERNRNGDYSVNVLYLRTDPNKTLKIKEIKEINGVRLD
jgi:RHS repeat-associated protein